MKNLKFEDIKEILGLEQAYKIMPPKLRLFKVQNLLINCSAYREFSALENQRIKHEENFMLGRPDRSPGDWQAGVPQEAHG